MEVQRKFSTKYAAAMILTVVASMNPEEIIIMGSDVQDGELSWIKNYCAGIIPEKHMVNISIDGEYRRNLQQRPDQISAEQASVSGF